MPQVDFMDFCTFSTRTEKWRSKCGERVSSELPQISPLAAILLSDVAFT